MQTLTIGVVRSRDMRTLLVHIQYRESGLHAQHFQRTVGSVTYSAPFSLDELLAESLGEIVLRTVEARLREPELPF